MSVETIFCDELGCDSELLPVLFDECNPSLGFNEINKIYISNDGYPFTNWTDPAEWATRISADSTDLNAIRSVSVIGTLDVEPGERTRIPGGKYAYGKQQFSLAAQIFDNNDVNYTFMRSMGCNRAYRLWYAVDGKLYGGNEGIQTILNGTEPITDDPDTFRVINVLADWEAQLAPLRIPDPIA